MLFRLVVHGVSSVEIRQLPLGIGIVGIEPDGGEVLAHRLFVVLVLRQRARQPEMNPWRVLLHPEHFAVLFDRLGITAAQRIDVREQLTGLHAVGVVAESFAVFDHGLVEEALLLVQDAEIPMDIGGPALHERSFFIGFNRLIITAGGHVGISQLLQCLTVARLFLEGGFQFFHGLRVIARLKIGIALAHLLHEFNGPILAGKQVFVLGRPQVPLSFIGFGKEKMDPFVLGVYRLQTLQLGNGLVGLVGVQVESRHAEPGILIGAVG